MKNSKVKILSIAILFYVSCLCIWLKPDTEYSPTERRRLKQLPELTTENIYNGKYMKEFDNYALDQFPGRDMLRGIKAALNLKSDNNGLYLAQGHINSMEYPLNKQSLDYATKVFQNISQKYLAANANQIYLSVIPDKNYFFAEKNGYLALDYKELAAILQEKNPNMQYIDVFPLLSGEDYYSTDIHWKQENLVPVADKLLNSMTLADEKMVEKAYQEKEAGEFYGVYYGQAALPVKPDKMAYLTNKCIENYRVYDYQNNREIPVYDLEKVTGDDPYAMFLGGSLSLLTIENPQADTDKNLIVFRDSFGSSIAPLLAENYAKTTLIDIRYIHSSVLAEYVDFANADVLFIYSVPVLNNSSTLK
ncbi:MAG: hypothetical protein J6A92_06695 [Lachnospiraceae bacterium]|nr:hypothetical protein [Lachnospiraceae bacterium]